MVQALFWCVVPSQQSPSRPDPRPSSRELVPDIAHRSGELARALASDAGMLAQMGKLFADRGHRIAVVGGSVRDALLGKPVNDLDFATSARPEEVIDLLTPWANTVWDVGIRFGTVGARKGDRILEITTYRAESYDRSSRKPEVRYGSSLSDDLVRRDFTINAMAVVLPTFDLVDEHGGILDLTSGTLRTPAPPRVSFSDDPLRMLRAARFVSQLGCTLEPSTAEAIAEMAERIQIVSSERVQGELTRLLTGDHPREGLAVLVDSGLAEYVLPELPSLRLEIDEHHRHKDVYEHSLTVLEQAIAQEEDGPDLTLRLAALLHDIGKPRTRRFENDGGVSFHHHEVVGSRMTRKRLKALRYSNQVVDDVSRLVELHLRFHGYRGGEWTDSAVRRYVRDAGDLLPRLHKLTRADSTTRNRRRALALQRAYDDLEQRIAQLQAEEELAAIRPELSGNEIMEILGIRQGPDVGAAYRFLLDLRLDRGPLGHDMAEEALRAWWAARQTQSG